MIKRHERPRQVAGAQRAESVGGVIERPAPIHVSNVVLLDPKDNKPTRVGVERVDGKVVPRRATLAGRGSTDGRSDDLDAAPEDAATSEEIRPAADPSASATRRRCRRRRSRRSR